MNYIIFGGTGFIGTHLAKLLKAERPNDKVWNLDVVSPDRLDWALENKVASWATVKDYKTALCEGEVHPATFVECDVRKPLVDASGALTVDLPFTPTSEDVIFNFAAIHRTPGHPDRDYFETNVRGAENVCDFAEKYGIRKMVFTSSIAPYGAAEELKEESTLPTPNTAYGISKYVAEKVHMMWQARGVANDNDDDNGRELTIVRPGVVFGKGENGNFTRLYWGIKKHTFAYPGRKDTIKACVYVKELVRFMLWRLEHAHDNDAANAYDDDNRGIGSSADIFNCTFEPAYTIEEIVKTIKKVTGLKQAVPYVPNAVIMPAAVGAKMVGSPMGICPARVKKLQISTNICGKKLAECGYKFKWTFEEAVEDWFEDNGRKFLK